MSIDNTTLKMQYIGACALLGRVFRHVDDSEERTCIEQAINDCVSAFPDTLKLSKTYGGFQLDIKK